jgi:hypothetical protein
MSRISPFPWERDVAVKDQSWPYDEIEMPNTCLEPVDEKNQE